jgi:hypothetical protein
MKVIVSLDSDCKIAPDQIFEKIKRKAKKISEIVLLNFSKSDKLIESFAKGKKIKVTTQHPAWDNIECSQCNFSSFCGFFRVLDWVYVCALEF